MSAWQDKGRESMIQRFVDASVDRNGNAAAKRVASLRRKHPNDTPVQLVERLTGEYKKMTVGAGAGIGATAAVPGVGTITSLVLSLGEAGAFIELTSRYVLTVAEIHGALPADTDGRRALVVSALLGESGVASAQKAAGTAGKDWARQLGRQLPTSKVGGGLGRQFFTRFALRRGAAMFGRAFPFGIGAVLGGVANHAAGNTVIEGVQQAFGGQTPGDRDGAVQESSQDL